jgi:hypothetical protein
MTAIVLGIVFAAGFGTSWVFAYGAGFRASDRMWDTFHADEERMPLDAVELVRPAVPVEESPEDLWPYWQRSLFPVLVFACDVASGGFWDTWPGQRLDRAAVWLGRFEAPGWTDHDLPPRTRHRAETLPSWAMPTGEWGVYLADAVSEEQRRRDRRMNAAIDSLVDSQRIGAFA